MINRQTRLRRAVGGLAAAACLLVAPASASAIPENVERPLPSELFTQRFGEACGDVALSAYGRAHGPGWNDLQAWLIGEQAGRMCVSARTRLRLEAAPVKLPARAWFPER
jgi:hypothetical protein